MAAPMSAASTAVERFARVLDSIKGSFVGALDAPLDESASARVAIVRAVFAAIWVLYDAIDLAWGMTERERVWFPHDRSQGLIAVQVVLIVSGVMLALGRYVWASGMVAAIARTSEAFVFFSLNDFFFGSVVYLLLAHSSGGPFDKSPCPKWVRDALIFQLGWIYVVTGLLKLNPDWLDGGQIFVRTQYLAVSHGWPYPEPMVRALASLSFDAKLSWLGAAGEITLGALMFARGPYWLAAVLAVGIHAFGALITNVWFFPASMAAGVLLLLPRTHSRPRPTVREKKGQ
jgi:hypothetical protein